MDIQIVLMLVLLSCFWLTEGCGRGSPSNSGNHFLRPMRSVDSNDKRQGGSIEKPDLCNFVTYDEDRDGRITKGELQAFLGDKEETDALFADLDIITEDGVVTQDEFDAVAHLLLPGCYKQ